MPDGVMRPDGAFYGHWVVANAWSESLGLGTTIVAGWLAAPWLESGEGSPAALIALAGAVLCGALFEGGLVGLAQQRVLRLRLPALRPRSWVWATALGAGLAWLLGMLPSTVMALAGAASGPGAGPEPGALLTYVLACALGLAAGPVLGAVQFLVLKRHLHRAGIWLWANALAWGAGMPLLFAGMDQVPWQKGDALHTAVMIYAVCAAAGAAVGAIHGSFLMRLLSRHRGCDTVRSSQC